MECAKGIGNASLMHALNQNGKRRPDHAEATHFMVHFDGPHPEERKLDVHQQIEFRSVHNLTKLTNIHKKKKVTVFSDG